MSISWVHTLKTVENLIMYRDCNSYFVENWISFYLLQLFFIIKMCNKIFSPFINHDSKAPTPRATRDSFQRQVPVTLPRQAISRFSSCESHKNFTSTLPLDLDSEPARVLPRCISWMKRAVPTFTVFPGIYVFRTKTFSFPSYMHIGTAFGKALELCVQIWRN